MESRRAKSFRLIPGCKGVFSITDKSECIFYTGPAIPLLIETVKRFAFCFDIGQIEFLTPKGRTNIHFAVDHSHIIFYAINGSLFKPQANKIFPFFVIPEKTIKYIVATANIALINPFFFEHSICEFFLFQRIHVTNLDACPLESFAFNTLNTTEQSARRFVPFESGTHLSRNTVVATTPVTVIYDNLILGGS